MSNKPILFICSANKDRSKTAEDYYSSKYLSINFESAGTNEKICRQLGTNYINKEQLDLVNHIYVMEHKHRKAIETKYGNKYFHKTTVLNVKDIYKYGSKELIEILESKISL